MNSLRSPLPVSPELHEKYANFSLDRADDFIDGSSWFDFLGMFRGALPQGPSRDSLNRLSNRLTKILSEARKLHTP